MSLNRSYGAVVVKRRRGNWKILLIKHKEGGHWSFPKGQALEGERVADTIHREVEKETGLLVELDSHYSYRSHYELPDGSPKEVFYYLARPKTDVLSRQVEEIEALNWFGFEEAEETLTYEEDREILEKLYDDLARASLLERAIGIALDAHAGQLDKSGQAYILHPLRVMMSLNDETDRICAVLHDVVEDSDISLGDLRNYEFSMEIVKTVGLLTRREGEDYDDYISRVLLSDRACRVKLMDLKDNMSRTPFDKGNPSYEERITRYKRARNRILARLQTSGGLYD
ncbi:MAG: NUDIX domain-containing protein [Tissierellia bacterium]|nr:NUDIX domain-containing protein [Tissierellia bacterium]